VRRFTGVIVALAVAVLAGSALPAQAATRVHRHHSAASWLLRIPAIRVTAAIIPTGVNRDGSVAVPSLAEVQKVGWYEYGAVPGDPGPAILFGHVDSYIGPAVFYRLYLLRPGVRIYVRAGGRSMAFAVISIEQVSKRAFPPSVYAPRRAPMLYLITCAGDFNYVTRHYDDNIIVTARLLQPRARRGNRVGVTPMSLQRHGCHTHVVASRKRVSPVTTGRGGTYRRASPPRGHPPGRRHAGHRGGS
jgi:sortase (surface protein transpeptidase)